MQHNAFVLLGQGTEESWFQLVLPLIFVIVYILAGAARIFNEKKDTTLDDKEVDRDEKQKGQWRGAQRQQEGKRRRAAYNQENEEDSGYKSKPYAKTPEANVRKTLGWSDQITTRPGNMGTKIATLERLRKQAEQQRQKNEQQAAAIREKQIAGQEKNRKEASALSPEIEKGIDKIRTLEPAAVENFSIDVSSHDEVRKGFIYSEILGLPKALRESFY
jgi:hypothetical protein